MYIESGEIRILSTKKVRFVQEVVFNFLQIPLRKNCSDARNELQTEVKLFNYQSAEFYRISARKGKKFSCQFCFCAHVDDIECFP